MFHPSLLATEAGEPELATVPHAVSLFLDNQWQYQGVS